MADKMFLVGLTGPTGSGKSEVARILSARQIPVIDADELARKVVEPGSPCLQRLAEEFSKAILREDGTLNRPELAKRAFATPEGTKLLNSITHPYIIDLTKRILMQLEQQGEPVAVIDAPLLFESGMEALCDITVAVLAPVADRQHRIIKRDGLTAEEAKTRMAAQPTETFYTDRADRVLHNDGDLERLRAEADRLADNIKEWAHG